GGYWVANIRPQWGAAGPWTVATIYGAILGIFIYRRFAGRNWMPDRSNVPIPLATVVPV
ncbi:MAG: hypothetical protein JO353_08820, partial [Phycisphaerae bacterium]|nr:hypothetical protein [Phycisphaerae bacterium]